MPYPAESFKFVIATQSRPKHDSSVVSASRAHSARVVHQARRKRKEVESKQDRRSRESASLSATSNSDEDSSAYSDELVLQQKPNLSFFRGNSDPFQSTAIEVTPEANQLLSFMRDVVYPRLQFSRFFRQFASHPNLELLATSNTICLTSFPASEHWKLVTSTLNDECSAMASLSTAATYMAAVRPEFQITALELRLQSSKYLRQLLARQEEDIALLVAALFWLFNAEARAKNFEAAGMLSRLLAPLLVQGFKTGAISLLMIMEFRLVEDDVVSYNLCRPSFDMDGWFPQLFQESWKQAEALLPPYPSSVDDIHPAVEGPLRQHFHNLRWIYFYWDRPFRCHAPPDQQLVFRWFMSRYHWVSGCLLNAYGDLMERNDQNEGDWLQRLLALTALTHTRVIGTHSVVGSVEYRGASEPADQQIKILIKLLKNDAMQDRKVADALLWVFYLGSSWETLKGTSHDKAWFRPQLLAHARSHNIRTWEACRFVLKSFFFVEKDVPDTSEWFQDVLAGK